MEKVLKLVHPTRLTFHEVIEQVSTKLQHFVSILQIPRRFCPLKILVLIRTIFTIGQLYSNYLVNDELQTDKCRWPHALTDQDESF